MRRAGRATPRTPAGRARSCPHLHVCMPTCMQCCACGAHAAFLRRARCMHATCTCTCTRSGGRTELQQHARAKQHAELHRVARCSAVRGWWRRVAHGHSRCHSGGDGLACSSEEMHRIAGGSAVRGWRRQTGRWRCCLGLELIGGGGSGHASGGGCSRGDGLACAQQLLAARPTADPQHVPRTCPAVGRIPADGARRNSKECPS